MFDARFTSPEELHIEGRLDAAQIENAETTFSSIARSCTIDCGALDYISSAGLGLFLKTQKRLKESGHSLRLMNLNKHMRDIFRYSGFDKLFEIL